MNNVLVLISALIIVSRCICAAGRLSHKKWNGESYKFAGIAASYSLVCGGAIGAIIGWEYAMQSLIMGIAGWVIFDRHYVGRM